MSCDDYEDESTVTLTIHDQMNFLPRRHNYNGHYRSPLITGHV